MANTPLEWKAIRVFHLGGGCRAINELSEDVVFAPFDTCKREASFRSSSYHETFKELESLGLYIVGTDFIFSERHLNGTSPVDWRALHRHINGIWLPETEAQRWSDIGHAAFDDNNGRMWDLSVRISGQLRVCSWRLRQISECYQQQLNGRLRSEGFSFGAHFSDGFTWLGYLAIQSFLVDACVLGDYLAEFYVRYVSSDDSVSNSNITSMSSLSKKLKKSLEKDQIGEVLFNSTVEGGWYLKLTFYRNLVVHCAPLAQSQGRLYAVLEETDLGDTGRLPAVRFPIPDDPGKVVRIRNTGEYYENIKNEYEYFIEMSEKYERSTDGLRYCHLVLGRLSELASLISRRSPIEPKKLVLSEKDIVNFEIRQS